MPLATEAKERSEGGDERTTGVGLARYAFEYISAAKLVSEAAAEADPFNMIAPIPAYFLAAHGIELTLKAFLRHSGLSLGDLVRLGHRLDRCNAAAKEAGLSAIFHEIDRDTAAFELLVGLNGPNHGLRYISTGLKHFPLWSLVEPLAVRLHQAVAPVVGYRSFEGITYSAYE